MTDKVDERKILLRRQMRQSLRELEAAQVNRLSSALTLNILKFFSKHPFTTIGAFAPLSDEPAIFPELEEKLVERPMAFPKFVDGEMIFVATSYKELAQGQSFGVAINEPANGPEVVPDGLLIPGLAFDSTGARLGRGKGFYDRYLEGKRQTKIGVCYDFQLIEEVPTTDHDQQLDFVITEKRTLPTARR